jgi:predicted metallo-beta-lactamase superfamily hydrolase
MSDKGMSMFGDEYKLKPQTAEEVTEAMTPQGMRKRLNRFSRSDALTGAHYQRAHYEGWSGEDLMTALAYEALLFREQIIDGELKFASMHAMPQFIAKDKP